jgi:hypothetical protein
VEEREGVNDEHNKTATVLRSILIMVRSLAR